MGATLKICGRRTGCAVLTTGVVISLTALTGGVAPAFAKPGDQPAVPTTTVAAPQPVTAPTAQQAPAERPGAADVPTAAAPSATVAPSAALAPTTAEAPVQTRAPEPEPSVEAPVQTRAPATEPSVEAPVQTRVPQSTPTSAPASSTPAPSPRTTVTSTTVSPSSAAPTTSATAPSSASPTAPSPALVAPSESGVSPTSSAPASSPAPSSDPSEAARSSAESTSAGSSSSATSSATSASTSASATQRAIERIAPETLQAPEQDVQLAKSAKIVEEKPDPAPAQDIRDISNLIDLPNVDRDRRDQNGPNGQRNDDRVRLAGDRDWDRNVRQWRPDWVEYDEYYRPVLSNPYRDPVRIVYIYQNAPRTVFIPPLARIVLEVAQFAAYSFTAVVQTAVNTVANVAVGSFFGGGYNPGFGLPLPPPPPALVNYANVPVQVRYPDATYQPFRVSKIVDVGDDAQYGERKVLLDGVTPAWGQWQQSPSGERSFEVHKTQQFPGLDDPRPGPLPGDYQLTLASDETPSGMTDRDVYLIAVAIACGALSIGAVILAVVMGRRRRSLH